MAQRQKRITMKLKTPNPLFEKWITEWRDKAKQENSKMQHCFSNALSSLAKYPLPLERGKDCKMLKGFGDKICQMLDDKLKEHKKNQGGKITHSVTDDCDEEDQQSENSPLKKKLDKPTKRKSSSKEYIPKEGSGGYAILIALYEKTLEPSYVGYLSKADLIRKAQFLSETSFTKPDPGSRYTAWSSMKTLISNKLVERKSHPPKFSLTDEGKLLGKKLYDKLKSTSDIQSDIIDLSDEEVPTKKISNHISISPSSSKQVGVSSFKIGQNHSSSSSVKSNSEKDLEELWKEETTGRTQTIAKNSSCNNEQNSVEHEVIVPHSKVIQKYTSSSSAVSTQSSPEESFILSPNTFDIILYVDTSETIGSNVDIQDDPILAELSFLSTQFEVKKLKVGDYAWISRDRTTKKELVLPYIVERKRMDDFGSSIKDGRYHEQKFRLKKCGIQNITYLIESYGKNEYVGLPLATLLQASTNTAIQDGFCIKFTENYKDTAKYLANFSSMLTTMFKSKTLVSCPKENLLEGPLEEDLISLMTFKEFNRSSAKNKPLRISDLFVKMLVQIKGMSVDKALAIVREYPTPEILRRAYEKNTGVKGEKLLAYIQLDGSNKSVGQVLSKIVYQLFNMQSF